MGCGDGRLTPGIARDAASVVAFDPDADAVARARRSLPVGALIENGTLLEQRVDDHDVRKHYANGAELVEVFTGKQRRIPERPIPSLRALAAPCVVRERCRLRLLVRQ